MPYTSKPISFGQAILLLMDEVETDKELMDFLKKIYLSGAKDQATMDRIDEILELPFFSSLDISFSEDVIDKDSTRRYFETHLAYETLIHGVDNLSIKDLDVYTTNLYHLLEEIGIEEDNLSEENWININLVLRGKITHSDEKVFWEYSDYIKKINSKELFPELSGEQRIKTILLIQCSFMAVMLAIFGGELDLPLDIYDSASVYSDAVKGKFTSPEYESTRSQHYGLMKGHMPLALDDKAKASNTFPYLKPSDQAFFDKKAKWVRANFSKLVHPFSNSISGTMLCQLRVIAKLHRDEERIFTSRTKKMQEFLKLLASAMLFGTGGHTLYEFIYPLKLEEVRKEFESLKTFRYINLESMFYIDNEVAFDAALQKVRDYNHMLLKRNEVLGQIEEHAEKDESARFTKK